MTECSLLVTDFHFSHHRDTMPDISVWNNSSACFPLQKRSPNDSELSVVRIKLLYSPLTTCTRQERSLHEALAGSSDEKVPRSGHEFRAAR